MTKRIHSRIQKVTSFDSRKASPPKFSRKQMGEFFYERRKSAGLTQMDVSAALGISQSAWSKFENGLHEPTCSFFLRFCLVTKTSPEAMYRAVGILKAA